MSRLRWVRRHPWWTASVTVVALAGVGFVLVYFAPQDLFLQTSVNEPLPTVAAEPGRPAATSDGPASGTASKRASGPVVRPAITVLGRGRFHSGEHATSGTAALLALPDGRRFVRLERLDTSNGPAVHIWLSAAPARASDDEVGRSPHLDLGGLKANHGNQNYAVPAAARVAGYRSVVIWCRRFDVVFGSAPITTG